MKHRIWLVLISLFALSLLTPAPASADVGSTIVARFWDSVQKTLQNRLQTQAPQTATLLQEAESIFLGGTEDITTHSAVRDIYKGMRVAGLLLLALCTVISLGELTEAGMMGQSSSLADWFKRFATAAFMTVGSIHFYGIWIRIFNALLAGFRSFLDGVWSGPSSTGDVWTLMTGTIGGGLNPLLLVFFVLITLAVLLILWFLIGGIRMAEMAIAVIIAPLVWPVYLIPSLEDIPRTAFRSFLGLNAVLLIIVAMLRMAIRMFVGGELGHSVWNFVPAISVLMMTIFLPALIKRLVGQGNTGAGGLLTVANTLMGLKGISMVASAAGAAAVRPPASAAIPQTPAGQSMYPVAPLPASGAMAPAASRPGIPAYETWVTAPGALTPGSSPRGAALPPPFSARSGGASVIEMGRSDPTSNVWDVVLNIDSLERGNKPNSNLGDRE